MIDIQELREALARTDGKLKGMDKLTYGSLDSALKDLTPREIAQYQEVKSIAQAEGKISLEVAFWAYRLIENWSEAPLADRVILTQLVGAWTGVIHR
jgi:hypothetical protein